MSTKPTDDTPNLRITWSDDDPDRVSQDFKNTPIVVPSDLQPVQTADDTPNPDEPNLPTVREQWTPVIKALIEVTDPSRRFEDAMVQRFERMMQVGPRSVRFENIEALKDEPPTSLRARVEALAHVLLADADDAIVEALEDTYAEIRAGMKQAARLDHTDTEEQLRIALRGAVARYGLHRWAAKLGVKPRSPEGSST